MSSNHHNLVDNLELPDALSGEEEEEEEEGVTRLALEFCAILANKAQTSFCKSPDESAKAKKDSQLRRHNNISLHDQ